MALTPQERQERRQQRAASVIKNVEDALVTIRRQVKVARDISGNPITGTTVDRILFAIFCLILVTVVPVVIGAHIGNFLTGNFWGIFLGAIAGTALGAAAVFVSLPHFLISVPESAGWVVINLPTGYQRAYGTGWHIIYPWEQAKDRNIINLRNVTQSYGQDYPAKDGPKIHVDWSIQYVPVLSELPYYIAVDETTIKDGFGKLGSALLSAEISYMTAEEARQAVDDLQLQMLDLFQKRDDQVVAGNRNALEELYGINLFIVSLADSEYEERYQKILTTQQISVKVKRIAEELREKDSSLTPKDALNAALIMNGQVSKQIIEAEGEGGQALASLLMAMSGANRPQTQGT